MDEKFNEEYLKNGLGPTYNKLRMLNYFRSGTLVGTDTNGNKYYENKDAPYGRYRWVEPATPTGVWAIEDQYDASQVRRPLPPPPPRAHTAHRPPAPRRSRPSGTAGSTTSRTKRGSR